MADQTLDDFLGQPKTAAWRRYVKWIVGAVVIVLLILLATRLFGGSDKVQYATQEVQRGNLAVTVSATGKLAPTNQVDVGSELSGLVTTVYVEVNDRVTKGQALALIDTARLDDAIAQSRAALGAAQATVQQNEATVEQSRANLTRFREVSRLSGGRVPAKVEMDQAEADLARAIANLRAAQANVVSQRAQLSSNQTQRDRAVIRSPVNGVVLARQIDAGQTVAASFNTPTLFVIAEDLTNMELQVAIDEADVGAVKDGQPATFTVDAFPGQTFPARITRVDLGSNLSAQTTSSTSTSTTQSQVVSYAAILSVSNPDQQLRPGMTATAEITTKARDNVLLVPNAALRFTPAATDSSAGKANDKGIAGALVPTRPRRGGGGAEKSATRGRGAQQQVYVLGADGTPQPVAVTTGETDGSVTEVTGGDLKPGMKVITGQMASGEAGKSSQGGGQRRQGGGSGGGQRQGGAPSGG
ncbi:MAG: efflux RND transporter periplasmic adaptor subunit [Sphingomonas sp.]